LEGTRRRQLIARFRKAFTYRVESILSDIKTGQLLLATLVHGTWGRGFLSKNRGSKHHPFWFEHGSPFLNSLDSILTDRGIPHRLNAFLWSGSNSVFARDKAASDLAEHLVLEHAANPNATQLIIAHSHGGNVALRALYHLQTQGWAKPLIASLATPYVEVHPAHVKRSATFFRATVAALICVAWAQVLSYFVSPVSRLLYAIPWLNPMLSFDALVVGGWLAIGARFLYWIAGTDRREQRLQRIIDATRLNSDAASQRLLVVRAIDDEPALALSVGTATTRAIIRLSAIFILGVFAFAMISDYRLWIYILNLPFADVGITEYGPAPGNWFDNMQASFRSISTSLFLFAGALIAVRSIHGRELATAPMECQINTQSVPDGHNLSNVTTLVSTEPSKILRHRIYNHKKCARIVADWAFAQLDHS
jgi:hypothetical protein